MGTAQQEPKLKLGPELMSYPEIAKRMSIGNRRVECARSLQNSMAVIHLRTRPWSEVRQLLQEGLDVQFRLKSVQDDKPEPSKSPNPSENPQPKQPEPRTEVWVMERAPETVRIESEQRKRFVDHWLEQMDRTESFLFFIRAFSDLPYKEVKEFFQQYEQQREDMVKQMMERADEFNNASAFSEVMRKYGPDLITVPPPILQRLKKTAAELKKMLQEMLEEEETPSVPEIQEFLQMKDEPLMQMMLLFADSMPNNASAWLLNRWWDQGLIPEMAREAIRNGISVRTAPLSQAVLKDIPVEDLLSNTLFKGHEVPGVKPPEPVQNTPPFDLLVLSLNLTSTGEALYLQAALNACLPDIHRPIPAYFSIDISLDGRTYAHVMKTDKKAWGAKNKQLSEFLKKEPMQKSFSCDRKSIHHVSGVLLAWAHQTGSEVIAEYNSLHETLQPSWGSPFAQTMTIDESREEAIARMEAEAIQSDQPVTDQDVRSVPAPSPPILQPEPPQPPAKQDVTLARTFGEKNLYDLQESRGVLIVRSRWQFLHHTWDTPSETVLKLIKEPYAALGERQSSLDYDTLYSYYRTVSPLHDALIDSLYFSYYTENNPVNSLRPAVHILSSLSPADRRRLLTEGGVVPLSRLSGAVLTQLITILRASPDQFPNAWHPGFAGQLPAWQLKLTLGEESRSGELYLSLETPYKERPIRRSNDEEDELPLYRRDFHLGTMKAITPSQKKSN